MITLENISKNFGEKKVLSHLNFSVKDKCTVGIVAPNGSGKSVIFELMIGKINPDEGSVKLTKNYKSNVFYQSQKDNYPDNLLVKDLIEFYLVANKKIKNVQKINYFLDRYGLYNLKNKKVNMLSGGQQRKLGIVIMMLINSKIVFLDEPTAGIDRKSIILFREDINKLNSSTKVITSHNSQDLLAVSDKLIFLKNGCIEKTITKKEFNNFNEIYDELFSPNNKEEI